MRALFDTKTGCGFEFGRMPIGASDFARNWYSTGRRPRLRLLLLRLPDPLREGLEPPPHPP